MKTTAETHQDIKNIETQRARMARAHSPTPPPQNNSGGFLFGVLFSEIKLIG